MRLTEASFVVVGNGAVVKKYWIQAARDHKVRLEAIVTREMALKLDHDKLPWNKANQVVVLATPTEAKCDYLSRWLGSDKKIESLIFVEKPYFLDNSWSEAHCGWLSTPKATAIRLLSQYSQARAAILYPKLLNRPPKRIRGKLIEGMNYYQSLLDRWRMGKQPTFIKDGPELDLGFHLLAIILRALRPWGVKTWEVVEGGELAVENQDFRKGEGFRAKLKIILNTGFEVELEMGAGKGRGKTDRFVEFDYGEVKIKQEYSQEQKGEDPVTQIVGGERMVLNKQVVGFNYYLESVKQLVEKGQTRSEKQELIRANQIALACRRMRESGL